MRRNYAALIAAILLLVEFGVPFGVEYLFPEWVRRQGPGGPYLAAFWLAALSLIGVAVAAVALALSFRGFRGRVTSAVVLGIHVTVGFVPVITMFRLLLGLY